MIFTQTPYPTLSFGLSPLPTAIEFCVQEIEERSEFKQILTDLEIRNKGSKKDGRFKFGLLPPLPSRCAA